MTSKERILTAIHHREADRVPLDVWMYREDVQKQVIEKYGSMDAFYESLHIDLFTAFPVLLPRPTPGKVIPLEEALEMKFPEVEKAASELRAAVQKYGTGKRMAVFAWTPGVFEAANAIIGMENCLIEMALRPELLSTLFGRLADWSCSYADTAARAGADVVHISDDWGQNQRPLFSPACWRELVYPADKRIVDSAKQHGLPVSLHSDGYVADLLDGIVEMGIDVLHPIQPSAGMNPAKVKAQYGKRLCLYGTFDITYTLPRGTLEEIAAECRERMQTLKPGGGFIFCTAHTVNPDVLLERVEYLYRLAFELGKY